jgi:hypothetical protein
MQAAAGSHGRAHTKNDDRSSHSHAAGNSLTSTCSYGATKKKKKKAMFTAQILYDDRC